jgi:hypothetical protein
MQKGQFRTYLKFPKVGKLHICGHPVGKLGYRMHWRSTISLLYVLVSDRRCDVEHRCLKET